MSKRSRKARLPSEPLNAHIESLSHDGRGVAHLDGKAVFIDGALPGEDVSFLYTRRCRKHDEGKLYELFRASDYRVEPRCAHFSICGGCALQHMDAEQQILSKQATLLDNLQRIGKVEPERVLDVLKGPAWGYRNKARLSVRYVIKKGRVLVGFREKRTSYVADIRRCEVLHPSVGERIDALSVLIQSLEAKSTIAQIEVAVGDDATVLVLRNLEPLSAIDTDKLIGFAQDTGLHIYLQPKGPQSIALLWPEQSQLHYKLSDYGLDLQFLPTDFTQVNPAINASMLRQALALLDPGPSESILDLFCGLGNFTLPIALNALRVVGVEGDSGLVDRARSNAQLNAVENAEYHAVDLTQDPSGQSWMQQKYDKVLLDPPRSGAAEMMPYLARLAPRRIVYVSCHPGSLARDAGILVNDFGFRLEASGVMDMFPHTAHVESMALFTKD